MPDKVWTAVRMNAEGVDDVTITSDLFRLERMNEKTFWVAVYRGDKRVTFAISSETRLTVTVTEDELGCVDDTTSMEEADA
jgi:hypothetical protein